MIFGVDQALKESGRAPFFGPLVGQALNMVLPKTGVEALGRDMD